MSDETALAQPRTWLMHVTIDELPITTSAQSQEIQQALASLAIDRKLTTTFTGRPGSFTFTLIMQAERSIRAALLVESTLREMCAEMTGRVPRMSSHTADDLGLAAVLTGRVGTPSANAMFPGCHAGLARHHPWRDCGNAVLQGS